MTKTQIIGLFALLLFSALLGFTLLTSGHNWAYSDFAAYILQAKSILQGNPADFILHNTITIEQSDVPVGPIAYPWGYPLLLAPIVGLLGISTLGMKLLNTLLFLGFLLSYFFLLRKRQNYPLSFLLTALFAFNPVFLAAQDTILSDIAFLFFSTFSIFLIDRWDSLHPSDSRAYLKRILIGGILLFAFLIRTNGLLLLPSLIAYEIHLFVKEKKNLVSVKENILFFAAPYLSFFILWCISALIFPDGQTSHLSHYQNFEFSQLWRFLFEYIRLAEGFFAGISYAALIYSLFGFFFFLGVVLKFKQNLLFIIYTFITLLAYISWPHMQGIRFLLPILPLFILLAEQGVEAFSSLAKNFFEERKSFSKYGSLFYRVLLITLVLFFFITSAQTSLRNLENERYIHGPFDETSIELFEYIKSNLPEDSIYIFFRPRVMRLMTNRDSILVLSCENLLKGDYVVINIKWEDMGQIAPDDIKSCPIELNDIYKNRRFIIYEVGDSP